MDTKYRVTFKFKMSEDIFMFYFFSNLLHFGYKILDCTEKIKKYKKPDILNEIVILCNDCTVEYLTLLRCLCECV